MLGCHLIVMTRDSINISKSLGCHLIIMTRDSVNISKSLI